MKTRLTLGIFGVLAMALGIITGANAVTLFNIIEDADKQEVEAVETTQTVEVNDNVGNGEEYTYEITSVNWDTDEIHGVPLNKESEGNKGIFLYAQEVPFDVEVGDRIVVVWGEYEDEFVSIERAYQAEDGSWVGESFYQ
jgi:hypothetical protein